MSRSPILLAISACAACSSPAAKPDAYCGTGGASSSGLVATAGGATLTYGNLMAGLNNDCPDPMAPSGIISMTIEGQQSDGTGLFTLCIQRPDLLSQGQPLGTAVKVVDVTGTSTGCSYLVDSATPPTGTATSTGECGNGSSSAGFALTLSGTLSLSRTCGSTMDKVSATLSGTVAVTPQ